MHRNDLSIWTGHFAVKTGEQVTRDSILSQRGNVQSGHLFKGDLVYHEQFH